MLQGDPVSGGCRAGQWSHYGWRLTVFLALLAVSGTAGAQSPLVVDKLTVDGQVQSLPTNSNGGLLHCHLQPGPHQLVFGFGPPDAERPPLRLRYRLEGVDTEWREAGGEMRLTLMVFNAAGEVLAFFDSPMRGNSEGWSNTLAQSRFTLRQEIVRLPPDAVSLRVVFNSGTWDTREGASHPTVGLAVIDDCRMLIEDATGKQFNLWPNPNFDEGEELDRPTGLPSGWTRGGMNPKIAQVLTLAPNGQGHALALVDDNPRSGAEWRCDLELKGLTKGGSLATVEWKELFTVGAAGGHSADYHYVSPGDYVFRVKAVTPTGEPTGHLASLAFSIPQVFWKTTPFLALNLAAFAAVVAGVARALTQRRLQRAFERLEQQRALECERGRIARDIHDDLGSSLTTIALLSRSAGSTVDPQSPAAEELKQINNTSRELTRTLDEIVWAVDPANDSLDGVANYLGRFGQNFLSGAGVRCRLDMPAQLPALPISAKVRHDLFLACKEALNNVVRHSGAREVNITLSVAPRQFMLAIEDDGKGLGVAAATPSRPAPGGHGLANIRARLAQIGGEAEIDNRPGGGVRVRLRVPLVAARTEGR